MDEFFGVNEDISITEGRHPYLDAYPMQSGVSQSFRRERDPEKVSSSNSASYLNLEFNDAGDYFFDASNLSVRSIENFYEFKFKLLQQLASEKFNFKEIYVVTSVMKAEAFTLLTAEDDDATLEVFFEGDHQSGVTAEDLTKGETKPKISSMKGVASPLIKEVDGAFFFKAQRLEVSTQGKEIVSKHILSQLPESMQKHRSEILRYVPTQVLPSNDIYPAKVHELFHWREMNLDDLLDYLGVD
ncbi:hypothetical protein [Lewinella sp. W8]|uniref:hypothetical protein n=1 Tax=Lewinella sp. W8 TaxID=2528208 RepID=UPI00106889BB|nr:hypothetical protein [Lewinella sp. W8]MTB52084.1 hypothetical protein [Lewinella sp. W8]